MEIKLTCNTTTILAILNNSAEFRIVLFNKSYQYSKYDKKFNTL